MKLRGSQPITAAREELTRLKLEKRRLREEREILSASLGRYCQITAWEVLLRGRTVLVSHGEESVKLYFTCTITVLP